MASIFGHVYFLKNEGNGLVKVGFSRRLEARRRDIERVEGVPLTFLATVPAAQDLESKLHRLLVDSRHHGEWFSPSAALTACISLSQRVPEGVGPPHYQRRADRAADHWFLESLPAAIEGAAYWGEWSGLL